MSIIFDSLGGLSFFKYGKQIHDRSEHFHSANAVCVREDIKDSIHPGFQKRLAEMYDGVLFSSSLLKTVLQVWM